MRSKPLKISPVFYKLRYAFVIVGLNEFICNSTLITNLQQLPLFGLKWSKKVETEYFGKYGSDQQNTDLSDVIIGEQDEGALDAVYRCPYCNNAYLNRLHINRHLRTFHKIQKKTQRLSLHKDGESSPIQIREESL